MTGVELIVAALVAGATAGVTDTASDAVRDCYDGLKTPIARRLRSRKKAREALEAGEADPEKLKARISEDLAACGASSDEVILAVARRLLELRAGVATAAGPSTVYVEDNRGAAGTFNAPVAGTMSIHGPTGAFYGPVIMGSRAPAAWPRTVGVLPALADCFQHRALVDDLRNALAGSGGTAVLTAAHAGVLSGMGGVGKTQLAAHLAKELLDDGRIDLLIWVTATSRHAILERYAQAAVDIGAPGAEGRSVEHDAARFHAWLTTTNRRWLVVLDDLTEASHLKGLWPPATHAGRTVVTTRLRGAALAGSGRTTIPVGVFSAEEAEAYVRARLAGYPHLADDPAGVAEDLGYLPLALSQATAFIINEDVPCSEYRRRFADRRRRLDDLVPQPGELPDDYEHTVTASLHLSVEAADRTHPRGLALHLLRLASVLDPTGIPTGVFTTTAARRWLGGALTLPIDATTTAVSGTGDGADRELPIDREMVRTGLRVLHRFNLVTTDADAVRMHGLVQRTVRDQLSVAQAGAIAVAAADALLEVWPEVERDRTFCQILRSNVDSLYLHSHNTLLTSNAHKVLFRNINSRGAWGDFAGATKASEHLLKDTLRVLGPDHPATLITRHHLAYWRGMAGDPTRAITELEQLLTDRTRILGPDHPDTLNTRYALAF